MAAARQSSGHAVAALFNSERFISSSKLQVTGLVLRNGSIRAAPGRGEP
jgi:hypothetical protein